MILSVVTISVLGSYIVFVSRNKLTYSKYLGEVEVLVITGVRCAKHHTLTALEQRRNEGMIFWYFFLPGLKVQIYFVDTKTFFIG